MNIQIEAIKTTNQTGRCISCDGFIKQGENRIIFRIKRGTPCSFHPLCLRNACANIISRLGRYDFKEIAENPMPNINEE